MALKAEMTRVEMYQDNLRDTDRSIAQIREKLQRRGGGGSDGVDPEKELRELESQLSSIQQQICQAAQQMKTKFGVDPQAKTLTD